MSAYFHHDMTRCHDAECVKAGGCVWFLTRKVKGWVSHALSLREVGGTGEGCEWYVPESIGVRPNPKAGGEGAAPRATGQPAARLEPAVRARIIQSRWEDPAVTDWQD